MEFTFFWHEYEENGVFSQWYPAPFTVEGITYRTCEQYMMAKKALLFGDLKYYILIMEEPDPQKCKDMGKAVRRFDGPTWDKCCEEIVYHANLAKFSQNPKLKAALLATGDTILAEASPKDKVWGIGLSAANPVAHDPAAWKGKNLLGKALMRVRSELRE